MKYLAVDAHAVNKIIQLENIFRQIEAGNCVSNFGFNY